MAAGPMLAPWILQWGILQWGILQWVASSPPFQHTQRQERSIVLKTEIRAACCAHTHQSARFLTDPLETVTQPRQPRAPTTNAVWLALGPPGHGGQSWQTGITSDAGETGNGSIGNRQRANGQQLASCHGQLRRAAGRSMARESSQVIQWSAVANLPTMMQPGTPQNAADHRLAQNPPAHLPATPNAKGQRPTAPGAHRASAQPPRFAAAQRVAFCSCFQGSGSRDPRVAPARRDGQGSPICVVLAPGFSDPQTPG
jgi:hypothetical protein